MRRQKQSRRSKESRDGRKRDQTPQNARSPVEEAFQMHPMPFQYVNPQPQVVKEPPPSLPEVCYAKDPEMVLRQEIDRIAGWLQEGKSVDLVLETEPREDSLQKFRKSLEEHFADQWEPPKLWTKMRIFSGKAWTIIFKRREDPSGMQAI